MSFGFPRPWGFSPLFDNLDFFTEPRAWRRNYVHPFSDDWQNDFDDQGRSRLVTGRTAAQMFDPGDEFFDEAGDGPWYDEEPGHHHNLLEYEDVDANSTATETAHAHNAAVTVRRGAREAACATSGPFGHVSTRRTDSGLNYDVSLPGLTQPDLKLDFDDTNHVLTLKADKKVREEHTDENSSHTTVRRVSFSRSWPVSTSTVAGDIQADFVDGVLHIGIAKTHQTELEPRAETKATSSSSSAPSAGKASAL